jgi:cytochrome P450 family 109
MQLPSFVREFSLSPLEWHYAMRAWRKEMRQSQPIWYDEQLGGWRLFRYEDIIHVQNDYKTFSSKALNGESISIIAMDPPRHRQLRSLVTSAFSARTIAEQAPRLQQIARELLQAALPRGEVDMVADFAVPFPTLVMADLLGLPRENWQRVKEWTDALTAQFSPETTEQPQQAERSVPAALPLDEIYATMTRAIEQHRQQPRKDILSLLLAAEVDGQHLTEYELLGFFLTLLVAGSVNYC